MKREELKVLTDGYAMIYNKDDADSVMDAMEARIKEIEADKLRQENYCESLVNENKRLNEIIISKDMVGAELHNENKALRHNLEDWKAENEALKERIKELEDSYKYFKSQNGFHIQQSNELAESCRDKNKLIETLLQRIDELEATQPKWISVEDEMPNDEALLLHENGLINVGGYVEEDKIWVGFGHVQLNDVHHWMPLPQRHKSED